MSDDSDHWWKRESEEDRVRLEPRDEFGEICHDGPEYIRWCSFLETTMITVGLRLLEIFWPAWT